MHRFGHHWIYGPPGGGGFVWWPGMLLSVLSILFLAALFIGLAWALLRWLMPTIRPMLTDIFGMKSTAYSALEILRQRYAAGEIDTETFEHMQGRLIASYQRESSGRPLHDYNSQEEHWTGYGSTYTSPASYGRGKVRMAEPEQDRGE
jgi:uncharacterized membrane protein